MLKQTTLNILKEKAKLYKIKKLLLFGSCLHKEEDEAGDIDLVVEGIDRDKFFTFYADIMMDDGIEKSIDLIDMSDDVTIMPAILENYVVIYES